MVKAVSEVCSAGSTWSVSYNPQSQLFQPPVFMVLWKSFFWWRFFDFLSFCWVDTDSTLQSWWKSTHSIIMNFEDNMIETTHNPKEEGDPRLIEFEVDNSLRHHFFPISKRNLDNTKSRTRIRQKRRRRQRHEGKQRNRPEQFHWTLTARKRSLWRRNIR